MVGGKPEKRTAAHWGISTRGWVALGAIVLVAAALRMWRLAEPPGGYLAFNEGFYLGLGRQTQNFGFARWLLHPADLKNPPLYGGLLALLFHLHAPQIASARLVSAASGVASVVLTALLGRLLFDERTGLVASGALAVMPGVVLVDHNIQDDALLVALLLAGVYLYVLSIRSDRRGQTILAGVCLGLAALAKQPAVLGLVAMALWEVWRTSPKRWIRSARYWTFTGVTVLVAAPWYVLQLVANRSSMVAALAGNSGRAEMSALGASFWRLTLASELVWMVFPLAAVAAAGGVVFMARQRKVGDRLVLVFLAVFLAYYLRFHFHSYYLLPIAPFVALAIGRLVMGAFPTLASTATARLAVAACLIAAMLVGAVVMMSGQKWGRWSPVTLAPPSVGEHVLAGSDAEGILGPALDLSNAPPPTIGLVQYLAALPPAGASACLLDIGIVEPDGRLYPAEEVLLDEWTRPVVFGYAIGQRAANSVPQDFSNAHWTAETVGPGWWIGRVTVREPSGFYIYDHASFRG